tara:strand:- start:206 stop:349 length:144 start_codon:yes stop_codon:yes gene_type:complete
MRELTLKYNKMNRKFTHYAINTMLISLASLAAFGWVNLVIHLINIYS